MTATQDPPDQAVKVKGVTPNIDVRPVQKRPRRPAPWPLDIYQTAVGKKWVMALTGIGLMGFVLVHMIGNLKMFLGKEADGVYAIDHYGEFLRELFVPLLPRTIFLWLLRGLARPAYFQDACASGG